MSSVLASLATPFAAAAIAAMLLTVLMRPLARRVGAVATPKNDRWHRRTVPLLGGVAVAVSTLGVLAATAGIGRPLFAVLFAGAAMFGVGLFDDFRPLKASTKLTAQIATACVAVFLGARLDLVDARLLDALMTILWVVALTNAFNLLDNMDGLCAGVATIAGMAFALATATDSVSATYGAALAGASAGFLVFNFHPASIFLGDAGSLFLGSTLAVLALAAEPLGKSGVASTLLVPVLVMLIPIFDTTFVTLSRKLSRRSASVGGRDHTSHRLVALGFTERQAVLLLYALAGCGAAIALGFGSASTFREARLALALLVVAVVLLGVYLARVRVYGGQDFAALRGKMFTPLLVDITYRRRAFEVILDLCLVAIAYNAAYVIRFDKDFPLYQGLFEQSLPIVIGCQMVSFFAAGVYRGVWQYFSVSDVPTYLKGVALGTITSVIALVYLYRFEGYSRGVFIINAMAVALLLVGSRVSFRVFAEWASRYRVQGRRALIYGAGDGGTLLVRELRNNHRYDCQPAAFVDDDERKAGKRILGLRVEGTIADLRRLIAEVRADCVILSTSKLTSARMAEVREICYESGTELQQLEFRLAPLPDRTPR